MWLADNAGPDEVFASTQPDMIEILAEREGVDLAGLTGDPSRLLE
jgi:hypothetical protein